MAQHSNRSKAEAGPRMRGLAIAIMAALLASAGSMSIRAQTPARAERFEFAAFGDMPYINGIKEPRPVLDAYQRVLDGINASNSAFIVHVGDITNGPYCGDSVVNVRYNEFRSMAHPFFYVFGDNEWTDCARGGFDPLERLTHLRDVFTQGDESLGRRKLPLERQSSMTGLAKYRENVRWRMGNVMFVGLDMPGSNNNWGGDSANPSAEYIERNAANLNWLRDAFAVARRDSMLGVAIFVQADPMFDRSILPPDARRYFTGFDEFLTTLKEQTVAFGKPVLLVHGDSHYFVIDKPMADSTGRIVANFTRAETFGAVNMHWLRITVDPADPNLFGFTPMLIDKNTGR
jgi:hypothetical protein